MRHKCFFLAFLSVVVSTVTNLALANPLGGVVVPGTGSATFSATLPNTLTIHQTTPGVVINWQDFSIRAGELTRFIQPDASAAALNRVVSQNPSQIFGNLQANGHVYLINPNGILFGPSAQVNVGSLVASTFDLGSDQGAANRNFQNMAKLTLSGPSVAVIRNEGQLKSQGDIYLISRRVENLGTIEGQHVGVAGVTQVELRQAGAERIAVLVGEGSVDNSGTISAVTAELKANGGDIYALAINNRGIVRANSIVAEGGRIFLKASGGTVNNSGLLDASSKKPGGHGGEVQITGDSVVLTRHSTIDVSGDAGGGTALVGGDFHGRNPDVPNASRTVVERGATIKADAIASGDGGKVVVWSDNKTVFQGSISAKGGAQGGAGGFAEVSSKHTLAFDGKADLSAPHGSSQHANRLLTSSHSHGAACIQQLTGRLSALQSP